MSFFHWSPIRKNPNDAIHTEFSSVPITFVPKNYVRQRKQKLYNNLLILLGGLWALMVSNDLDTFDTETRIKLKNILAPSGLFVSHLIAVPLIIWKLQLHYSIVIGAMGMSVTTFFFYVRNPIVLSIVICLRTIFVALFDVSATIYIVKIARMGSSLEGNAVYSEILTTRSFTTIFSCTARIISAAWFRYSLQTEIDESEDSCGTSYCPRKLLKKPRIVNTLSVGQNTIFIAVAIVVALSGIILIAMYLKPITSFDDTDLSDEPRISSPYGILNQLARPKAKQLAILIITCVFMYEASDEFGGTYMTCSFSFEYTFFIASLKEFSFIFGAMSCVTLVDFTGFYWLYNITLLGQFFSYLCLVVWDINIFKNRLSYLIFYHILCITVSVETSILQLFVVQTLGDEEVSAWCFYYVISDMVHLVRTICDFYVCTAVKLWIFVAISPIAIAAVASYSHNLGESSIKVNLYEPCSLLIKTPKKIFVKPDSYDLKIIIENSNNIRKIETFLERKYTLKSKSLVPPPDDIFSESS